MGNQLRALEAGLAVARILERMLVIPDYIADNGEGDGIFCPRQTRQITGSTSVHEILTSSLASLPCR